MHSLSHQYRAQSLAGRSGHPDGSTNMNSRILLLICVGCAAWGWNGCRSVSARTAAAEPVHSAPTSAVGEAPGLAVLSIFLPNPDLLHQHVSTNVLLFVSGRAHRQSDIGLYPEMLSLDITGGRISSLNAIYGKAVSFRQVESRVNEDYGDWASETFLDTEIRLWRVETMRFVIQLSTTEDGRVRIIYIPISTRGK
jgi:hypothetical protein